MSGVFGIALSGLQASQASLKINAQNIANANTPGYVRAELKLTNAVIGDAGGVKMEGVRRAADQFLARVTQTANAASAGAAARSETLDRAQALFGDPTDETSLFASLDRVFEGFAEVSTDPGSTIRRVSASDNIDSFFTNLTATTQSLQDLIREVDTRISDTVQKAQAKLDAIAGLNIQLGEAVVGGADASSSQNAMGVLLDDLAKLMDIQVMPGLNGGVQVRTTSGLLLVGDTASKLSHSAVGSDYAVHNLALLTDSSGASFPLDSSLRSGEIRGLIDARDKDLKGMAEALGGYATAVAEAFNAEHNQNVSAPAPKVMTGRQTGLLATDSLNFTGDSVIGLVDTDGKLVDRLTIDFDAGTITRASNASVVSFTNVIGPNATAPTTFTDRLNQVLSTVSGGSATFTSGVLKLDGGTNGLAVQQSSTDPSARAGRGFGHFFGLNDLIRRDEPGFFEAGASGTDAHGLNSGGQLSFRVLDSTGAVAGERVITISGALASAGSTWNDLVSALNVSGAGGIGQFATASFDASQGRLVISAASGYTIDLRTDDTTRGTTGVSASSLFGSSHIARASRSAEFSVRSDIKSDSNLLSLARPDLTQAIGTRIVEAGDTRGAVALNAVRDKRQAIPESGFMGAQTTSLATYSARFGGEIGRRAENAHREAKASDAVAQAASERRASVEGVSIDDELVKLTAYQQNYAASARVIQAATDMLDTLLRLGT